MVHARVYIYIMSIGKCIHFIIRTGVHRMMATTDKFCLHANLLTNAMIFSYR